MKKFTGYSSAEKGELQILSDEKTDGDVESPTRVINDALLSVTRELPRLSQSHPIFHLEDPLPAKFTISVEDTEVALTRVKLGKATGPDGIPPPPSGIVRNFCHIIARPLTAIFNSSLREGHLPIPWKTAHVVPLPTKHPPKSVENDLRPISRTPIVAKVFESLVLGEVSHTDGSRKA